MRFLIGVERNRAATADILTAMRQATATGLGNFIAADRTFVASDVDDADDALVFVLCVDTPHRKLHALAQNGALFIYTAAHRRHFSGNDLLRNIQNILRQCAFPIRTRNLAQHFVFQMLYFGVKLSHRFFAFHRFLPRCSPFSLDNEIRNS